MLHGLVHTPYDFAYGVKCINMGSEGRFRTILSRNRNAKTASGHGFSDPSLGLSDRTGRLWKMLSLPVPRRPDFPYESRD